MQRYIDLYSAKNRHETVNTNVCDHVYEYLNILKFISNYKYERSVHKQDVRLDKSSMSCWHGLSNQIYFFFTMHQNYLYCNEHSKWNLSRYILFFFYSTSDHKYAWCSYTLPFRNTRILLWNGLVSRWEILVAFNILVLA